MTILVKGKIVSKTPEGFLFEPMTLSKDVRNFLSFITEGIDKFGEISISKIQSLVPWSNNKINVMLELLSSNQICILNRDKDILFFPDFKRG